tara:strand:+ start:8241 stop:9878 length:1638 start_codon:yes stop_codon:yes gene_type:complete
MIRDVKNAIMGILDDMDEERFMSDTLYEHRITIDYDEVANIYIKHINTLEKRMGVKVAHMKPGALKRQVKQNVAQVYSPTNVGKHLKRDLVFGLNKGRAGKVGFSKTGKVQTGTQIRLFAGKMAQRKRKVVKGKVTDDFVDAQKAINFVYQELFHDMGRALQADNFFSAIHNTGINPKTGAPNTSIFTGTDTKPQPNLTAHGQRGKSGFQTTVAQVGLAEGIDSTMTNVRDDLQEAYYSDITDGKFASKESKELAKASKTTTDEFYNTLKRKYKFDQVLDYSFNPPILKKGLVIECELSDPVGNKEMREFDKDGLRTELKNIETALLDEFKKQFGAKSEKFRKMKGSPSFEQAQIRLGNRAIILGLLGKIKGKPDLRLKVNKKLLQEANKTKSKKKSSSKIDKKGKTKKRRTRNQAATAIAVGKGLASARGKGKVDAAAGSNPLALKNLLNEVLPQEVAKRMQSPALNYRTGRFANSVRVDDVAMGPRGGLQGIEYTYRLNPYETFEPGNKQGSVQRDPRKLIGGTIREIAQGMLGTKFVPTRRV